MEEFAEQYVENLEPRESRYDTRLGDDFYVCTFPNNVKTWIYVYEFGGHKRRKTIGVYPDVSLAQAREALVAAKRLREVEQQLLDDGLAGEVTRERPTTGGKVYAPPPSAAPADPRLARANTFRAAAAGAAIAVAAMFALTAVTDDEPGVVQASGASSAQAAAIRAAVARRAAAAHAPELQPASARRAPTDEASRLLQQVLSGTVAREQLTFGVSDHEPIDRVVESVELGKETRRIFYFTELRGMAGELVTHRWLHNGELVAEIPLRVGEGWRWPIYSSVIISPEMAGTWRVVLYNGVGDMLESEEFSAELPEGSAAPGRNLPELTRLTLTRADDRHAGVALASARLTP